jgi:DNA polymerase III epsilon subunit-like protein
MFDTNTVFVALDLETTGLDTSKDSIIEIAAIRFSLKKNEEGLIWSIVNREERSMLIQPERELTEEISMITGITDSMLIGKETWEQVQERV